MNIYMYLKWMDTNIYVILCISMVKGQSHLR